jgi:hypothetical protein
MFSFAKILFPAIHVNRDKSDVTTSFGTMDWSDVYRVFWQAGSSFLYQWSLIRQGEREMSQEQTHGFVGG